jgi:hypothetical protein
MFTVSVDVQTDNPVTSDQIMAVAKIGGVATGEPDGRFIGTIMTVEADDAVFAVQEAEHLVKQIVGTGTVVAAEALTVEEFDRRQALVRC